MIPVFLLLFLTFPVLGYVASVSNDCTMYIIPGDSLPPIVVPPGNATYLWIDTAINIGSACNYTITQVSYASLDVIQTYACVLAATLFIGILIIGVLMCYVGSFWIERRSMQSRRILRFVD